MLRARLITAAVAIPLLIYLVFCAPMWLFGTVVLAITFIALREFAAMALEGVSHATTMTMLGGMTIAVTMSIGNTTAVSAGTVVALAGVLIGTLATARDMRESVGMAGQILLGCLYAGMLLPHFIWVRGLPDGPGWVCFVLACVMAGDAGGYFAGVGLGRRKLWPSVSPNKTVEGALGSFALSLVAGVLVKLIVLHRLGPIEVVLVAGCVNVLAQLGDLLESMLKRAYDVSDSGWIFPGHGGVLDRTDSLVLPIVFVYYYAMLARGYAMMP
ncbi:MAG: phosphatidate cytidylyltransferase [Deltaproteobacteria bacterium]|nr:MAG: phosphatidate cytidylyltransferase [Deltaproteobacteria bacterium]